MTDIETNLAQVKTRIADAAQRAGRDPAEITLVAVTKTHPADTILAAYQIGLRHFGENRPEEGEAKIPQVHEALPGSNRPTWHMVGHIQSRKTGTTADYFDYVHSIDRFKIARRLSAATHEAGESLPGLLECNVSGEESKWGFDLAGWERNEAKLEAFLPTVERILDLPGLTIKGLMTMAPLVDDPETVRPVFASLRSLREALRERFPSANWNHLSMGMTDDFEVAIEEGATMVRIGRAIFGPRRT